MAIAASLSSMAVGTAAKPKATPHLLASKTLPIRNASSTISFRSYQTLTTISIPSKNPLLPPIKSLPPPPEYEAASGSLKSRLAAGETLYGLFLLSASPTLAEIAGLAGYDYVVVDMEHGPGGISDALPCLRALAATRTPAVLRLPEPSDTWAKKALDLGPQGIMFPMVDTPAAAAHAVACCRFPPRGIRGSAHTVVRASAYGLDDGYLTRCEEEILVMCQVEAFDAVAEIEAIAAVEGVDVVQMGPMDLSASMGYLWDPGNRKVRKVLRDVERKVLGVRKRRTEADAASECGGVGGPYLGGFAMPHDPPEELKARGYHLVAGAVDVGLFRQAAVEDVQRFRLAETEIGEEGDEYEKPQEESYWSE
ncbi:hypothetical protein OPV22_008052 [Ensete ventricosum]|uniref:HpcH/HpaI aldolase/citrate lyase domain-containing protein n=1 Tax=Ensete ventricosum TaxID=4639 RepID=A0AAV8PNE5_ENSVE|nr:hypothetical protein OPV22_008052 [Ensete ventricosum]RZR91370.1 hypothetical protein BHM03_00019487 [Ensete ventricosum]